MAERKVLIKYFPKNFDHSRIVKRGRGRDKLMMVRNMLPMSLRCNTCSNYLYIGTKFNMRMQICNQQTYLGIKMFRFYFKCTTCYAEITFITDPKHHDYIVETGATRNYEAIKDAQHAQKYLKKLKDNQKEQNSMKYLEGKSYDSKREMDIMQGLEDIKNLNKRNGVIDPEDLLQLLIYKQEQEVQQINQEEQAELDLKWNALRSKMICQKQVKLQEIPQQRQKQGEQDNQQLEKIEQNNKNSEDAVKQKYVNDEVVNGQPEQQIKNFAAQNTQNSTGKQLKEPVFKLVKSKIASMKKKIIKVDQSKKQVDAL